jgi:hypothetical protein
MNLPIHKKTFLFVCIIILYMVIQLDTDLNHDINVVDTTLLSFAGDTEPEIIVTSLENGDLLIWNIQKQIYIKGIAPRMEKSLLRSKNSTHQTSIFLGSLVASQIHQSKHYGHVVFTCMDELNFLAFQLGKSVEGNDDTNMNVAIEDITSIFPLNGSIPVGLDFINDDNRICILVTNKEICVIDCLQKCIIKKIDAGTLVFDRHSINTVHQFSKAIISFPFVGLLSDNNPSIIRYRLDSVFSFVGSMNRDTSPVKKQSSDFKPLLMDEETVSRWMDQIGGQQKRLRQKDCNLDVKSSGYGVVSPKMKLGRAPCMMKKAQHRKASKAKNAQKNKEERKANIMYPIECSLLDCHQKQHDETESPCLLPPILSMAFDPYGNFLATTHKNNRIHILKLPFSKYKSASCQISDGHPCSVEDEKVDTASCRPSWSQSAGLNGTHRQKFIAFHNKIYSLSPNAKSMSTAYELGENVSNTTFFSRDECILFTKGNELSLQRLSISSNKNSGTHQRGGEGKKITLSVKDLHTHENDRNKYNVKTRHPLQSSFSFEPAQRITSIASVNGSMANLIGCACSDKSIQTIDIVQNKVLWSSKKQGEQNADDGLTRVAHSIAFPQSSPNVPLPSECYNLLAAASTDNGGLVRLFDLRSGDVVQKFRGHVNRRNICMTSFSPCVRYIAVGSEGYCSTATLYDLRGGSTSSMASTTITASPIQTNLGTTNQRNTLFRDGTVTDCQFNPIYPQLVTGSLNGQLRWYSSNEI